MKRLHVFFFCCLIMSAQRASADTYTVTPGDDVRAILQGLVAGDEVIFLAGVHLTTGFLEVTWAGQPGAPIIVRAADGARPIIEGVSSQNVININGAHFEVRGLDIRGGSHGLRLGTVSDATFEDLKVHDVADVAISCNRPGNRCERITVRGCELFNTGAGGSPGEGMYLGCNDAACVVADSVFEDNYIHDIGGSQGDGIELKTGSYGNVVRDNVIIGTQYPAVTLYGFPDGAGERNLVEGNFIWGTGDNGVQVVGQAVVRNNVIIQSGASGIASKPSQGYAPHDLLIAHNTVLGAGDTCMRGNEWAAGDGLVVVNNAFYCEGGTAIKLPQGLDPSAVWAGNVHLGTNQGPADVSALGVSVAADLTDASAWDLYPTDASALIGAGDPLYAEAVDFNGTPRDANPDAGAYERTDATNPGWLPERAFKVTPDAPPPPLEDVGPTDTDTSTGSDASTGADTSTGADASTSADTSTGADTSTSADASTGSDAAASDQDVTSSPSGDTNTNADAAPSSNTEDDGCGCSSVLTPHHDDHRPWLWASLGLLSLAWRRRVRKTPS
jgi:hypothetical protein